MMRRIRPNAFEHMIVLASRGCSTSSASFLRRQTHDRPFKLTPISSDFMRRSHRPQTLYNRRFSSLHQLPVHSIPPEDEHHAPSLKDVTSSEQPLNPLPDFHTNSLALQSKTTGELIHAAIAFGLCTIPPLVQNAESILHWLNTFFGEAVTHQLLRWTWYDHFCPGPNVPSLQPTLSRLQQAGIAPILDYAAEDRPGRSSDDHTTLERLQQSIVQATSHGCAAVKVTALGDPAILARFARAIVALPSLCTKLRSTRNAISLFPSREPCTNDPIWQWILRLHEKVSRVPNGAMDEYVRSNFVQPSDFPCLPENRSTFVPHEDWVDVVLTCDDVTHLEEIYQRGRALAQTAIEHETRVLIDAEQVRYQPAIDALVRHLQRSYNTVDAGHPVIYNAYQCYLKDTIRRLQLDLEHSQKYRYHLGIKLVRGAYMESERSWAAKMNLDSPIHSTFRETHDCYNRAIEMVLQAAGQKLPLDSSVELMCATHNQESIELAIRTMNQQGIHRSSNTVSFAQLFGMKDNLTYNLGLHGFRAYKYIPYGEIDVVTPYLIRRANENSAIRGGASDELHMIRNELLRRVRVALHGII